MMGEKNTMRIELNHVIIRDFERKDAENLYRIVREKDILRFMPDWAENSNSPQSFFGFIDWHQTQQIFMKIKDM